MGLAMGLAFAFLLILMDPSGIGTLIDHGGTQATTLFVSTLVLIFCRHDLDGRGFHPDGRRPIAGTAGFQVPPDRRPIIL
jgi:hypothetical protein